MIRCKQFTELYDSVLFNYQWLYSKMSACPLQLVLSDFEDASKHLGDDAKDVKREIQLVADSLRLGGAILGEKLKLLMYSLEFKCMLLIRNLLFVKRPQYIRVENLLD